MTELKPQGIPPFIRSAPARSQPRKLKRGLKGEGTAASEQIRAVPESWTLGILLHRSRRTERGGDGGRRRTTEGATAASVGREAGKRRACGWRRRAAIATRGSGRAGRLCWLVLAVQRSDGHGAQRRRAGGGARPTQRGGAHSAGQCGARALHCAGQFVQHHAWMVLRD